MVAGEQAQLAVPEQVGARVTHADDRKLGLLRAAENGDRRERGSHSLQRRLGVCPLPDRPAGLTRRLGQRLGAVGGGEPHLQRVEGQAAGDLPTGGRAHPVRHGEQRRADQQCVLIGGPGLSPVRRRARCHYGHWLASVLCRRIARSRGEQAELATCLGERPAAAGDLQVKCPLPALQLVGAWVPQESSDLAQRNSGLAQQQDQARLRQLARGVVPVPGPGIHRGRNQQARCRIAAQHLGRQPGPRGKLTDGQQLVHQPTLESHLRAKSSQPRTRLRPRRLPEDAAPAGRAAARHAGNPGRLPGHQSRYNVAASAGYRHTSEACGGQHGDGGGVARRRRRT